MFQEGKVSSKAYLEISVMFMHTPFFCLFVFCFGQIKNHMNSDAKGGKIDSTY